MATSSSSGTTSQHNSTMGAVEPAKVLPAVPGAPVATAPGAPKTRANRLQMGIKRNEVVQIKTVDTDLVFEIKGGKTILVKDGALRAVNEEDFTLEFLDESVTGQAILSDLDSGAMVPMSKAKPPKCSLLPVPTPAPLWFPLWLWPRV
jgi:hypothetical protein